MRNLIRKLFLLSLSVFLSLTAWAQVEDWKVQPEQYNLDMSLVAMVAINGSPLESSNTRIAAFVNDELRGVAKVSYNTVIQEYTASLTVFANHSGEKVEFRFYHQEEDIVYTAINEGITFEANAIIGTWDNPLVLTNNYLPSDIVLSDSVLAENKEAGTLIGHLSAVDKGGHNTFEYSLVNGADSEYFEVSEGSLLSSVAMNYEEDSVYTVYIAVDDGCGVLVNDTLTVSIADKNDLPVLTSSVDTLVYTDVAFSHQFTFEDEDGQIISSSIEDDLPEWLSYDADKAMLSGTPLVGDLGEINLTLSISDGEDEVSYDYTLEVKETNYAPEFTSTFDTVAYALSAYSYQFEATDPNGDELTFQVEDLPDWLTFDAIEQTITGEPAQIDMGTVIFNLVAIDSHDASTKQRVNIKVNRPRVYPTFVSVPDTALYINQDYSYTFDVIDSLGGDIHIDVESIPQWLDYTENTQTFSGKASSVGNFEISIKATDDDGDVSYQTFTVKVLPNAVPEITSLPLPTFRLHLPYRYAFTAYDADGDSLIMEAVELPEWLTFTQEDGTLGSLSGTIADSTLAKSEMLVTLSVTDGKSVPVEQSFYLQLDYSDYPLFFNTVADTSIFTSSVYQYSYEATSESGEEISYVVEGLPEWLTHEENSNRIYGTPFAEHIGIYHFTITATTVSEVEAVQHITFEVEGAPSFPEFTSEPVLEMHSGEFYSYQITATDSISEVTVLADSLPSWLGYDALTNTLSGYTDKHGTYEVILKAVNEQGNKTLQRFTVRVILNNSPQISSDPEQLFIESGTAFRYVFASSDADGDLLDIQVVTKPDWLTFTLLENGIGLLEGVLEGDSEEDYLVVISVTDGKSPPIVQSFYLSVMTSLESEAEKLKPLLYPNPASEKVTVQLGGKLIESVWVFDTQLKPVKEMMFRKGEVKQCQLDLSALPAGIYLIKVLDKEGNLFFVKQEKL